MISVLSYNSPTRTSSLQSKYISNMKARFKAIMRDIKKSIADNDCFGLRSSVSMLEALPPRKFEYSRSADKLTGFMAWLDQLQKEVVLQLSERYDIPIDTPVLWSSMFLKAAYQKGMSSARSGMLAVGLSLPPVDDIYSGVYASMGWQLHTDRMALIYTRNYNELKGITQAMDQQISRILAEGIMEGTGPYELARKISSRVEKIGIVRATTLARTEIVQTYNTAALSEYEAAEQLTGKKILVMWLTARDSRVRLTHRPRDGVIYDRDVAQSMLGEPNCRGTLIPYIPSLQGEVRSVGAGKYMAVRGGS